MKRRNVGIIVAVIWVVFIAIVVKIFLGMNDKISNDDLSKELTEKTTSFCEALDKKDYDSMKSLSSKELKGNIDEAFILNLFSSQNLLEGVDVKVDDFYCKIVEVQSEEFLRDLEDERSRMDEEGEYEIKVIVDFGFKGVKDFGQKWNIYFVNENDEFKISDVGTILNTLSENE